MSQPPNEALKRTSGGANGGRSLDMLVRVLAHVVVLSLFNVWAYGAETSEREAELRRLTYSIVERLGPELYYYETN